jgi:hypothetical protein
MSRAKILTSLELLRHRGGATEVADQVARDLTELVGSRFLGHGGSVDGFARGREIYWPPIGRMTP